jgi:ribosomal protein L37E
MTQLARANFTGNTERSRHCGEKIYEVADDKIEFYSSLGFGRRNKDHSYRAGHDKEAKNAAGQLQEVYPRLYRADLGRHPLV